MGAFYTSTQIYNPEHLSRHRFITRFNNKMKSAGYIKTSPEESELEFVLSYTTGSDWVAISSRRWDYGNLQAQQESHDIAFGVKVPCVRVQVAGKALGTLEFYDEEGILTDTAYFGSHSGPCRRLIGSCNPKVWSRLIAPEHTIDEFVAALKADYEFPEDAITHLAPLLSMDSESALFSALALTEDDDVDTLCYRREVPGERLNFSIKKIIYNTFTPYMESIGFIRARMGYPYYVRPLADGDIYQILTFDVGKKCMRIMVAIVSPYRYELTLDEDFEINRPWMISLSELYKAEHRLDADTELESSLSSYSYDIKSVASIEFACAKALEDVKTWAMPILSRVNSLEELMIYNVTIVRSLEMISLPSRDAAPSDYAEYTHSDGGAFYKINAPITLVKRIADLCRSRLAEEEAHPLCNLTPIMCEQRRAEINRIEADYIRVIESVQRDDIMIRGLVLELAARKERSLEMFNSMKIQ